MADDAKRNRRRAGYIEHMILALIIVSPTHRDAHGLRQHRAKAWQSVFTAWTPCAKGLS
jgi:hypothetical protein